MSRTELHSRENVERKCLESIHFIAPQCGHKNNFYWEIVMVEIGVEAILQTTLTIKSFATTSIFQYLPLFLAGCSSVNARGLLSNVKSV